jgi:pyruvate,water dikinase
MFDADWDPDADPRHMLSHAAVVARELGIPCVMGTGDGSRRLRTGDTCRVDGTAGTVTVIEPAAG